MGRAKHQLELRQNPVVRGAVPVIRGPVIRGLTGLAAIGPWTTSQRAYRAAKTPVRAQGKFKGNRRLYLMIRASQKR